MIDVADRYMLSTPIYIASAGDEFIAQGTIEQQRKRTGTDAKSIADRIYSMLNNDKISKGGQ